MFFRLGSTDADPFGPWSVYTVSLLGAKKKVIKSKRHCATRIRILAPRSAAARALVSMRRVVHVCVYSSILL
jgi:hypothetical protein